jgi:glycosyltransferase involved in cell wall biosynthesis
MKLLVISHTPHYSRQGQPVGWGPTVRELDFLAEIFGQLIHLAPHHQGPAPPSALAYTHPNIQFVPVRPAGGRKLNDKLAIARVAPEYLRAISAQIRQADAVHLRCPANISLLALLVLSFIKEPEYRWFKYAGNWAPEKGADHLSYKLQRFWLARRWGRGPVTVGGAWPKQPDHVVAFFNPCLNDQELALAGQAAAGKNLTRSIRLIFVGRTESAKGLDVALQAAAELKSRGISFNFDILGNGPERTMFERMAARLELGQTTRFHGWLPRNELNSFYAGAHFLLFPSRSEGWPKAVSEAMAFGVIPLASRISSIPQTLAQLGCGITVTPGSTTGYVEAILAYLDSPERWQQESRRGYQAAQYFTYRHYKKALDKMFIKHWNYSPLEHI